MSTMEISLKPFQRFGAGVVLALLFCTQVMAIEWTVTPTSSTIALELGESAIVTGDILNLTGMPLLGTDLFGSFSGYPDDALKVSQLLGMDDMLFPDRSITSAIDLFSIELGTGAQEGATYAIEFFFVDVNGVFSNTSVIDVTVAQAIPEPGTWPLIAMALPCLALLTHRTNRARYTSRNTT